MLIGKRKYRSVSTKIAVTVLAAFILFSAVLGVFSFLLQRAEITTESGDRALAIASTVSGALDKEEYAEIMSARTGNDYYEEFVSFLNDTLILNNLEYLYVVDAKYGAFVTYFGEGVNPSNANAVDQMFVGEQEDAAVFDDLMFETLSTGVGTVTDMYDLGGFGKMISGFAPITDSRGNVLGVVGVDLSINEAMAGSDRFGLIIIAFSVVMCVLVTVLFIWYIRTSVDRPIKHLVEAADNLAAGNLGVSVNEGRNDEIGLLENAFARIVVSTREQARLLGLLAAGDLTIDVRPRCKEDTMGNAMRAMVTRLNGMIATVKKGIEQVSHGSSSLSQGSQIVAERSAEQALLIERLSHSIGNLTSTTEKNAEMAGEADGLSAKMRKDAEKGSVQMDKMLEAVNEINSASQDIDEVTKVIDDIAFQTYILAINASVEAARAGAHGKGFAVVADEVRNLAGKSAQAAKDTNGLIMTSMEKAALGSSIAKETSVSLRGIVEGIIKSAANVRDIAQLSNGQTASITQISSDIMKVAEVIAQNGEISGQSAASIQDISDQVLVLEHFTEQFKLRD